MCRYPMYPAYARQLTTIMLSFSCCYADGWLRDRTLASNTYAHTPERLPQVVHSIPAHCSFEAEAHGVIRLRRRKIERSPGTLQVDTSSPGEIPQIPTALHRQSHRTLPSVARRPCCKCMLPRLPVMRLYVSISLSHASHLNRSIAKGYQHSPTWCCCK